ncbi:MAG: hypothetical protein GY821_09315 [Gammaproteobacteria bacterium]|nr:hypothetical protein [Gammaproteobacteria bacterium]
MMQLLCKTVHVSRELLTGSANSLGKALAGQLLNHIGNLFNSVMGKVDVLKGTCDTKFASIGGSITSGLADVKTAADAQAQQCKETTERQEQELIRLMAKVNELANAVNQSSRVAADSFFLVKTGIDELKRNVALGSMVLPSPQRQFAVSEKLTPKPTKPVTDLKQSQQPNYHQPSDDSHLAELLRSSISGTDKSNTTITTPSVQLAAAEIGHSNKIAGTSEACIIEPFPSPSPRQQLPRNRSQSRVTPKSTRKSRYNHQDLKKAIRGWEQKKIQLQMDEEDQV